MKILLIEDEIDLANGMAEYMRGNDLVCEWASTIQEALARVELHEYDCIVLDIMLPDGSGFEVLEWLQKHGRREGVILLSAIDSVDTKINGLKIGADDYLTKPFHQSELLARIIALVRRKNIIGNDAISFSEIQIDVNLRSVRVHGIPLDLTKSELDLLLFLIGNNRKVLSKAAIAEHLSGDMADMLNNHDFVYAHIKNLKKKLSSAGCADYVTTVYGLGYKWQG